MLELGSDLGLALGFEAHLSVALVLHRLGSGLGFRLRLRLESGFRLQLGLGLRLGLGGFVRERRFGGSNLSQMVVM